MNPSRKWTHEEKAIINEAVVVGRLARDFEERLPGRSRVQIQCQLGLARKKLRGGHSWYDPETTRADARAIVRQGVCPRCRMRLVDEDSMLTCCSVCMSRHHPRPDFTMDPRRHNLSDFLPWIYARQPGHLASLIPSCRRVVDVFGGSGRLSKSARRLGHKVIYNDVHPLLGRYVEAVRDGKHVEVNLHATDLATLTPRKFQEVYRDVYGGNPSTEEGAAVARMAAFNGHNCHLDQVKRLDLCPLLARDAEKDSWKGIGVRNEHFAATITDLDHPRTVFLLDPPWPGSDFYENNMDWRGFRDLVTLLRGLRGRFLMVLPTQRRVVRLVAQAGLRTWLRRFPQQGCDLIVANFPVKGSRLEPLNGEDYGLVHDEERERHVDVVIDGVAQLGGGATRRELEGHLRIYDPYLFGALLRARAEGRLTMQGKMRYALTTEMT